MKKVDGTKNDWMNFEVINALNWEEVINDTGKNNWQKHWFLDGENARVFNGDKGMEFYAGARFNENADHGVLWTKESFCGDVKLSFNNMNLYHISFAAFGMDEPDKYTRARRYNCGELMDTDIKPDYDPEELFQPMMHHKITVNNGYQKRITAISLC